MYADRSSHHPGGLQVKGIDATQSIQLHTIDQFQNIRTGENEFK